MKGWIFQGKRQDSARAEVKGQKSTKCITGLGTGRRKASSVDEQSFQKII